MGALIAIPALVIMLLAAASAKRTARSERVERKPVEA